MKNHKSFVFALLACLSICLSSCAEKGSGCYYSNNVDKLEKEDSKVIHTQAVNKEEILTAE